MQDHASASAPSQSSQTRVRAVIHPYLDFWLLGGASVAIWMIMIVSDFIRGGNTTVETRFLQIGAAFSLLTLICNHPHFIISYQFGYGRGLKFIRQHWFALIVVPLALLSLFASAFFSSNSTATSSWMFDVPNSVFEFLDVGFRFGLQANLGNEIMGWGIWLMYLTVGWHYSKQVFGCMMVYGHYDKYRVSSFQKVLIKGNVFSVAVMQFSYLYRMQSGSSPGIGALPGTLSQLTPLNLPEWLYTVSSISTILFFVATLLFVFGQNFRSTGRWPSANFLIPWIALHVWWVPFFQQAEFTFLMVPFFHSLQYLPFAYRVGTPNFTQNRFYYAKITAHAVGILVIGFMAFEGIPNFLDHSFGLGDNGVNAMFFVTAFAVFLNIHHFFIDSVVWRFNDPEMRAALFATDNTEQAPPSPLRIPSDNRHRSDEPDLTSSTGPSTSLPEYPERKELLPLPRPL